jgi:hypothetical protein
MLLVGLGCFSDKLLILLVGMELKNYWSLTRKCNI